MAQNGMRTFFVYDKETRFILSGFDCCVDDMSDGFNTFTRPYSCPEFHPKNEKCRLDYIYRMSKKEGLTNLKYESLEVVVLDGFPSRIKQTFIKNPTYLNSKEFVRGWWRFDGVKD